MQGDYLTWDRTVSPDAFSEGDSVALGRSLGRCTHLLANNIIPGLDVRRDFGSPRPIPLIHHPNIRPNTLLINSILCKLNKLKLVDIDVRDIPLVRRHPRRDGALVAVQPVRPVERDVASRAHLGDSAGGGRVALAAGDVRARGVGYGAYVAAAEGDA